MILILKTFLLVVAIGTFCLLLWDSTKVDDGDDEF